MHYSALSQLSPNIVEKIKCQNNTNPSLILLLIQQHYIKDLSLLQADSEYDSYLHMHNTTGIPSVEPQLLFHVCHLTQVSPTVHYFFHIWDLLTSTITIFLPKAMNKNLYSYDFVHNYLFRIFIPVPWFSLVLIYMDHCIRNKLTNNI